MRAIDRDCRVDLRKYKDIMLSILSQLDNIIANDTYTSIADIHKIAVIDAKILASILNTRGLQSAKHIVYVTEDDFAVLDMYTRYTQQRPLIKQRLTDEGIARIIQVIQGKKCYKILDKLKVTVLHLCRILQGFESSADDVYSLLNACGSGICQQYVEYPLPDALVTSDRSAYKTKQERNSTIIQMYLDGAGLRQLENAGFGIKRAAILSVLQQAGVYMGVEEGKERHQSGEWRTNRYNRYDSTANKARKIANSKRSTSKKLRKVMYDLRSNSALTQQQIADLLGCSKTYYCNVENGRETPSEIFWNKIEVLFGLDGCEDVRKVSTIRQFAKTKKTPEIDPEPVDTDTYDLDVEWGRYSRTLRTVADKSQY